jgi:hypothetical protein
VTRLTAACFANDGALADRDRKIAAGDIKALAVLAWRHALHVDEREALSGGGVRPRKAEVGSG